MTNPEDTEPPEDPPDDTDSEPPSAGVDELLYALADALRAKKSKEAIAGLIEKYSNEISVAGQRRYRAMRRCFGLTRLL
jgi:hypothetical protein